MIIRGEDHLSNSASQAALYYACNKPIPSFFHLPLICSATGKKLSKRDFGFSLSDLQNAGYLPQAIVNYIGLLGHSFTQEIMDLETLAQAIPFNEQSPKNSVRYDVEKLRWINHAWIQKVSIEELAKHVTPFLQKTPMACSDYMEKHLPRILEIIRPNLQTLADVPALIDFITNPPTSYDPTMLAQHNAQALAPLLQTLATAQSTEQFMEQIKILPSKEEKKNFFVLIRLAITGQPQGLGIKELMQLMPYNEIQNRIRHLHKSITD
jgi:glutamyl/glutaminyl-tRNA synthetase